ncbi:MAG: hypothetical protein LCI02_18620 [Proteobacteria bacterium]|nr:hypothetical protein [Pseudomonadota bacterium]
MEQPLGPETPSTAPPRDAAHWLALARAEIMRGQGGDDSDMSRFGRAALAAAQQAGDTESEAVALHYAWHRAVVTAPAAEGERLLNDALRRCRELGSSHGTQLMQATRTNWLYSSCRFVEAIQIADHVLADPCELHPLERLQLLQTLALSHKWSGHADQFFEHAQRSVALADEAGPRYPRAGVRNNLAGGLTTLAFDPEAALVLLDEARELLLPDPVTPGWLAVLGNRVQALDMLGRHDEAYEAFAADLSRPGVDRLPRPYAAFTVAALIGKGLLDEAEAWLGEEGIDGNSRMQMMRRQAYRAGRMRLLCARGRHEEAKAYALASLEEFDAISREPLHEATMYECLRQACSALGDIRGALDAAIAARRACLPAVKRSGRARYLVAQLEAGLPNAEALGPVDRRRLLAFERAAQEQHDRELHQLAELKRQAEAPAPTVPPFLAYVVHELRNPIGAVTNIAQLLMHSSLDPRQRRFVELMRGSADTLLTLVNDVLDLAKLETGRFEFEPAPTALDAWLTDALAPFVETARLKGLALRSSLDSRLPARLVFDAGRLRQVLVNLVSNAMKFTRKGFIEVALSSLGPGAGAARHRLRCEVRDSGCGVAPAAKGRLFQEFVQADAAVAASYGGTGLGLALCRQFIERLGGRIGLDSELGVGSCFWFELELPTAPPAEAPAVEVAG